jgi:hypothetical protein
MQNTLTANAYAGLKKLWNDQGTSALSSTAVMEQIPVTSGTDLKGRYPDDAATRWLEDGPGHG